MARISIKNPVFKKWLWFGGIYAGSVVGFAIVIGVLEFALPK